MQAGGRANFNVGAINYFCAGRQRRGFYSRLHKARAF